MPIHATAIVHPRAQVAEDAEIQAFSIVDEGVSIGPGTVVGPHCVITGDTKIGANNRFFSNAQIGIEPQDLKQVAGARGKTVIGNGNIFRETVTVSSGTVYADDTEPKVTSIGDNGLFMTCSHVAHDCRVGNRVILANHVALAGHVTVQDGAILGGLTGIHQFAVVGTMAYVGAMSRISKYVPPYMIVEGQDPKCFGPNRIGLERNGFDKEAIGRLKAMFRLLCRSGLNASQALDRIEAEVEESEERRVLVSFIRESKRGVTL